MLPVVVVVDWGWGQAKTCFLLLSLLLTGVGASKDMLPVVVVVDWGWGQAKTCFLLLLLLMLLTGVGGKQKHASCCCCC